jgi:hypothetical protein
VHHHDRLGDRRRREPSPQHDEHCSTEVHDGLLVEPRERVDRPRLAAGHADEPHDEQRNGHQHDEEHDERREAP